MNQTVEKYLKKINLPLDSSHKGQNGKLLIIGGSELVHAASKWSLDIASKFVDMVFYSSVPENNELIREAKGNFWNGIIVPRGEVESYIQESDCILIGPGMVRDQETKEFVNNFLKKYIDKKWVIDAGALQVVEPNLLNKNHIVTPHKQEMVRLEDSFKNAGLDLSTLEAGILLKGKIDEVTFSEDELRKTIEISGGNAGMTKGGSGDSLAGLVAALYCTNDQATSMVVGSYINKKAGDKLYETVGLYFNTSDLVEMVPKVFWEEVEMYKSGKI